MKNESDLLDQLASPLLTWFDRIELECKYHELKKKQVGGVDKPGRPHKKVWGLRQTADKLDLSYGGLCEDIFLHKVIVKLAPALRNHALKKDALKEAKEKWWQKLKETKDELQ